MKNQSKTLSILKITFITLALMFVTGGCERTLIKVPETDEETKSIHQAVVDRDIKQIKLLLSKGIDINTKDYRGRTPLHLVLDVNRFGYRLFKNVAELLISEGSDINSKDNYGRTPLHLAAESAGEDIVKLLK